MPNPSTLSPHTPHHDHTHPRSTAVPSAQTLGTCPPKRPVAPGRRSGAVVNASAEAGRFRGGFRGRRPKPGGTYKSGRAPTADGDEHSFFLPLSSPPSLSPLLPLSLAPSLPHSLSLSLCLMWHINKGKWRKWKTAVHNWKTNHLIPRPSLSAA